VQPLPSAFPLPALAQGSNTHDTDLLLGLAAALLNPAGCSW